jgi:hypothetical protein
VRGFDPLAWRPPERAAAIGGDPRGDGPSMRLVVGYVAAVVVSCAILLLLVELGWLPVLF